MCEFQAEVSRLKEQIPIFDGTGACDDMQTAIKGLILTTETLRQETTLKSERNASLEAQLNMVCANCAMFFHCSP